MFSAAFAGAFAGGQPLPAGQGFAGAFAGVFAGIEAQQQDAYICPMMAQAALADGAAWSVSGSGVRVGGSLLIGPAGKVFAFASPEGAARWVENARVVGLAERALMASIAPAKAAAWKAKKREKLSVIAGRVVNAAARQGDALRRAALLAEADFALAKWA